MEERKALAADLPRVAGNTDTSFLKIVALLFMIVDHVGVAFFPHTMELRVFGRIAMPLYAWCLVVGSEYTRNAFQYALRLFVLGVVSQPFYVMALSNPWTDLNILFLFGIAVLAIAGIKFKTMGSQFWAPALCIVLLQFVNVDYGLDGLLFILALYATRRSRAGLVVAFLAFAAYWGTVSFPVSSLFGLSLSFMDKTVLYPVKELFFQMQAFMWMALPLILVRTRTDIRMPKWLGYGLYPLHLAALVIVGLIMGISLSHYISLLGIF